MRHLFTRAVGLRLRDCEEVAMVLGDGAAQASALCHKIPHTTPGVGSSSARTTAQRLRSN